MPYVPLQIRDHVKGELHDLIRGVVDQAFCEVHFILTCEDATQGPKGSLQASVTLLLMAATDGAAQLFCPGDMTNGARFKKFIVENFAMDGVTTSRDWVAKFLWDGTRCSLMHRFGLHTADVLRKFGRALTISDDRLAQLERDLTTRPFSDPFFVQDDKRTVVWVDGYYWELRNAIIKALDTPEKVAAVEAWIKSGKWDRTAFKNDAAG